ncbi:hypothetical protein HXX76_010444 [Chlamydomonas incerta]|uniref:Derlin n=1 Tax=Chlamydomonas incerta TaxID=51695 RepID=A0A835VWP1_CHLIN|nr:hypothetical protein HXX76_010444 [Chlamydomonas incerta]|eukprot:KAG2428294.1 hypothetical protein HXX76_010444 [Chlamydomonas incerta]
MSFLTTAGCALEIITPFNVYFNAKLVFKKLELWRLVTNFFFFGNLGLDFVFHMFFLIKYCKSLEEGSFRGRSADFLWMLLFGGGLLTALAPWVNIQFLGSSLTFMMVYVWGRRHQYVNLSFLGIFNFTAPYLPWVLLAFSLMLGSSPVVDLMGMAAGHVYYFLEDVYPRISGRRPLRTPALLRMMFPAEDAVVGVVAPAVVPPPEPQDAFEPQAPAPAPAAAARAPAAAAAPAGQGQQAAAGAAAAEVADGNGRHPHTD